ncbi:MAG: agmatinase [Pseudomonadota bacterium]
MNKNEIDHAVGRGPLRGERLEPTYSGVQSFLRRQYTRDLDGVDLAVVGVPFDLATTNRAGARGGPAAVRAASSVMAWERPYGLDFDPRTTLAAIDYGDVLFDFGRPEQIEERITEQFAHLLDAGVATLALGGDHYVTYPILKAMHRRYGTLSLLHFDAHSDTWVDEPGRVHDHGTMLRHAVEEGLVDPSRSVQIGLRTHNPDTMGFHIFDAPCVHRDGVEACARRAREILGAHQVYLTFDIDCLDPAFAPGTGTPVSGGLSSAQALALLRSFAGLDVVGADVVEVAPAYDHAQVTALAAAHIAYECMALYAARPGGPAAKGR